jgi:DNA-binding XRE family transcriptional regulator
MTQYVDNVRMQTELCCTCHIVFATPQEFHDKRRKDGKTFYCPSGHPQCYNSGLSEADKLRQEVERMKSMREAAEARANKAAAERDDITKAHQRMRKRIVNGVCICCNRTFQNLMNHMRTEHPEAVTLKVLRESFGLTRSALAEEIGVSVTTLSHAEKGFRLGQRAQGAIDRWVTAQEKS